MTESTAETSQIVTNKLEEAPIRVLHVDDEARFLKTSKQILEMQGNFEVEAVSSVEEAAEKMKTEKYDVVVCDYQMPGKDGLQFLEELRREGDTIPFVMFTGRGREEVAIRALNLGADGYFNKHGEPGTVYGELAHGICQTVEGRRAIEALRGSESKSRTLLENLPQKIFFKDKNSVYIACNGNYARDLKIKSDEIAGKTDFDFYPEKLAEKYRKDDQRFMTLGNTEEIDEEYIQDGRKVFVRTVKTPVKDEKGNVVGILGIFWDITERKKIEETLRESKEQISGFMDSATDGFMLFDSQLNLVEINKSALKILGLSRGDVIGKNILDISPDTKDTGRYNRYREVIRTTEPFTVEDLILHPKFGEKHIALKAFKVGDGLGIIGTDITERKKAEAKVESERRKLKSIIDSMADPVCITSLEDKITMVNNAAVDLFQVSREELLTLRGFDLATEEDLPKISKAMQDLLKTGLPQNVEVTGRLYGAKDRPFWMKFALLKDKNGEPAGIVTVARDITERKKAEEKLKVLNEKLGVVGGFTRHDVRNKLSAITGNVYLAKQKKPDDEILAHLREVDSTVSQIVKILDFASAYEKLGVEKLFTIDVGNAVDEAISLFSDLFNVEVVNDCHGVAVLADSLLRQLFYNLIHNSLMHGEKVSHIRTYFDETDKDKVMLIYEDNGVGIPKTEKEKIFEKGYGKGTGYGLFLIKKMCEIYGWAIRETGKCGKGAQFTITIPKTKPNRKENYRIASVALP